MRQNSNLRDTLIKWSVYLWNWLSLFILIKDIRPKHILKIFKIINKFKSYKVPQQARDVPSFYITEENIKYLTILKKLILLLKVKRVEFIYYKARDLSHKFDFLQSSHIITPIYKFIHSVEKEGVEVVFETSDNIISLYKDIQWYKPHLIYRDKSANRQLNVREFSERKITLESYPTNIYVELTKNCNLNCTMCSRNTNRYNPNWNMSFSLFKEIADTLFPYADFVDLRGFGESSMLKDFEKFIDYALKFNCQFHLITNLTVKNDALWERLIRDRFQIWVSFDGATKKTFEFIRKGADFDTIISNLRLLVKSVNRFNTPITNLRFIVCVQGYNLPELPDIVRLANDVGIKKIMFSPVILEEGNTNDLEFHQSLIYENTKKSLELAKRYGIEIIFTSSLGDKKLDNELGLEPFKRCIHPWSFVHITYDGGVCPCNNLSSYPVTFGNLNKKSFGKIWNSPGLQLFRISMNTKHMYRCCDWCHRNRFYFW